ncbi:hypothetical protein ABT382_24800 [Streptomyces pharetrae]|uniref:DUF6197 family protein n=1 Tax=Streptomyces pharetrae TaxID=291370 RepID=UPI00334953CC
MDLAAHNEGQGPLVDPRIAVSAAYEDGARCLYGALHAEAASTGEQPDALAVRLEAIRRHFSGEDTVPHFNDSHEPRTDFRVLDQAAALAHDRGL